MNEESLKGFKPAHDGIRFVFQDKPSSKRVTNGSEKKTSLAFTQKMPQRGLRLHLAPCCISHATWCMVTH